MSGLAATRRSIPVWCRFLPSSRGLCPRKRLPACRLRRAQFLSPDTAATIGAMKGCAAVGAIAAVHPIGAVVIAAANMRSLYRGRFVRLASLCRFAYLADAVVNPLRRRSRCRRRLTCCFGPNMSGRASRQRQCRVQHSGVLREKRSRWPDYLRTSSNSQTRMVTP